MTPIQVLKTVIRPTLAHMGERYQGVEAERMLVAIGMQESGFRTRRQRPVAHAKGWWQFERSGCAEALRINAGMFLDAGLPQTAAELHEAIEWSELGACMAARLLLWRIPAPLPGPNDESEGWNQYAGSWLPGKPRPEHWRHNWGAARATVMA